MRCAWAERVAWCPSGPGTGRPAGAALLLARERYAAGRSLPGAAVAPALRLLGAGWLEAASLPEAARRLPAPARWVLAGVADPADLWQAEARWWAPARTGRLRAAARPALRSGRRGRGGCGPRRRRLAGRDRAGGGRPRRLRWRCSMRWPEPPTPAPMSRVAVVAPDGGAARGARRRRRLRQRPGRPAAPGTRRRAKPRSGCSGWPRRAAGPARVAAARPDLDLLERAGRGDLLAGEAQLEERAAGAVRRGAVAALAGLDAAGGPCRSSPRGWPRRAARWSRCRLRRAATRRPWSGTPAPPGPSSRWCGPTRPCRTGTSTRRCRPALAYVVMFGMMFGDVGHGLLLLLAGLAAARRPAPAAGAAAASAGSSSPAPAWPAPLFGLAYGEFVRADRPAAGALAGPAGGADHAAARRRSAWARCCWPARTRIGTVNRRAGGRLGAGAVRAGRHRRRRALPRRRPGGRRLVRRHVAGWPPSPAGSRWPGSALAFVGLLRRRRRRRRGSRRRRSSSCSTR